MISTIASLRELAGDALIAVGLLVRGRRRPELGLIPGAPWRERGVVPNVYTAPIPRVHIREALDDMPDSTLIGLAASLIAGWSPILIRRELLDMTDVDLLIDVLRDRATQFRVVEADSDNPFPNTPADLLGSVKSDPTK